MVDGGLKSIDANPMDQYLMDQFLVYYDDECEVCAAASFRGADLARSFQRCADALRISAGHGNFENGGERA